MTTHDHQDALTDTRHQAQTVATGMQPATAHTTPAMDADATTSVQPATPSSASSPVPGDAQQQRPSDVAPPESTPTGAPMPRGEAPPLSVPTSSDGHESSIEASLFANHELAELRARWASVQATFVDDPRECVHKADGLVANVVDQLTSGFAETRSRLEERWARGEEASTEDLRVALRQYREFFERLLVV
jgi:hypothetical protein